MQQDLIYDNSRIEGDEVVRVDQQYDAVMKPEDSIYSRQLGRNDRRYAT